MPHVDEQGKSGNPLKRDFISSHEASDATAAGAQASPQPSKQAKTGAKKTHSATPSSGPNATSEGFLKKLAAFIKDLGGDELVPGWKVDVCSSSLRPVPCSIATDHSIMFQTFR